LLGNAVKYTQPGGRITLASAPKADELVELAVTDNGPGLSLAQQAHLYEPFNRLGQESSSTPGTGIGLVICKRLVEGMQGVLSVESVPGKGCKFAVTLPTPAGSLGVPAGGSNSQATAVGQAFQPSGRVLYIEDNLANAELMRGFLSRRQLVELDIQHSAVDGLVSAHRDPPDMILLDLRLPDVPGLDVLNQLQKSPLTASIPVVVVSASVMPDAVSAATAAGAKAFLTKPLEMLPVLTMLDRWLPAFEPGQSVN
jgi:CheY-like chemotaxis protein/anti-sigma regulatory factor (Ser/Thr protein kinase)